VENTPPVKQMEDVPEEEWGYWTAQAWAGCGVIGALIIALFLPLVLEASMGGFQARLIGFGIGGFVVLICVAIISRLTYKKRQERRELLRQGLEQAPNTTGDEVIS
jgi:nitrate/nitrite transporter NarK